MAKNKQFKPQKKGQTLADRIATKKKAKDAINAMLDKERKARLRMAWAMIIAMDELEDVKLTPKNIADIVDGMNANLDEYDKLVEKGGTDGEEFADAKFYARVCRIFDGDDAPCDYRPERIFDADTILKDAETGDSDD